MPTYTDSTLFHLWFPNLFGYKGGIQVYTSFFLHALQNLYPQSQYDVFLKHDVQTKPDISWLPQTRFHFAGAWSVQFRTALFAAQIINGGFQQRPNLVIATHLNFTVAAYWLKRLTGIPYWTVAHGIEAWNIKNSAIKTALHHADRILAVSNYTRDRLLAEQNLKPNKVCLLPNTFDSSHFQPAPKPAYLLAQHKLKPEQPVILTVARLAEVERYKGYDQVLKALPQIRHTIPDVHYIIVGKGDDRPRIEQLITQLDLQDCVTLAGFVADEQLCDYYNLCDVFAMPSKKEGFGIVYLEALACGKPVLAGNQDGATDALCHGELGALINPDDVEAIALTLIQILQGAYPNTLIYQPEALRQKVIEHFGFERFQQTLATLVDKHFPPTIGR
ncbi:glycosyltransferase [Scytonema sp. UIC 10036]|uniref:glycosyltransferase n=1 Tax=Scytonema sp. UIC 10036 TaxID=2304196 RepID=UPI0012DA3898|nr:glycosyltransferase [Scytonema sp. UIC 10036]MUG94053.1 glycosyltransferase [Scytonema sp. UIC 10036]